MNEGRPEKYHNTRGFNNFEDEKPHDDIKGKTKIDLLSFDGTYDH